jgi:hypothetical protein
LLFSLFACEVRGLDVDRSGGRAAGDEGVLFLEVRLPLLGRRRPDRVADKSPAEENDSRKDQIDDCAAVSVFHSGILRVGFGAQNPTAGE